MSGKTKSWMKYSKGMAASIIQIRFRKYYNTKLGLDYDNLSNYTQADFEKVMEKRKNNKVYQ
jgi:hypothetical protein|tara:strand:+ start:1510 stop:1695 length:186 start_codon:yes stop_codon:yes gene_type:complete